MAKRRSKKKSTRAEEKPEVEEKKEDIEVKAPEEDKKEKSGKKGAKKSSDKKKEVKEEPKDEKEAEEEKPEKKPARKKKGKKKAEEPAVDESPEEREEREEKPVKAIDDEDEYAITMLGWATAGYDTSVLEESLSKGDKKKFSRDYRKFQEGVEHIEEMKKELETLNIAGVEKEVDELLNLLSDPMNVKKAEKQLDLVKKLSHAKDLEVELESIAAVDSLKDRANKLKKKLQDPKSIDEVEEEMKDLRREFQEQYAENMFLELIDEKPREVKRIKVIEEVRKTKNPMLVKDLFVFTSTGRFMGHKTARKGDMDKNDLIQKLNSAKEIVSNENISSGMSVKVPKGKETLLVHKGEHLAVGLIISGQVHRLTGQLLKKGVELMEHEDADAIANMDPAAKKPEIPHLKKNMKAILYAAVKLGDQMKK